MKRKILFLASDPTASLRLDKEVREITEGLKRSNERHQFELVSAFAVRVNDLRRSLLDHAPRIVHFAGHDGVDGIVVEDEHGSPSRVPNEALAELFKLCAHEIECVILNACYSDTQAEAIAKHIPYVVGMKAAVSDDAAIEFAVGFYDALGAGKSIEDAFRFGCNAIAMKGIPEHLTPVLKKKVLTESERLRLESTYSPVREVYMDVSVITRNTTSWDRGEDTILRYSIDRNENGITIENRLGYLDSFAQGGPIAPMEYLSPMRCPFNWDFPVLDFKILNNRSAPLFLTEVILDVDESREDPSPLFTIRRDTQRRNAGTLILINEGVCELVDITILFNLEPGQIALPTILEPPFRHSVALARIEDTTEVDLHNALREEGVDVDGLIQLSSGEWEEDSCVIVNAVGTQERLSEVELETRWRQCLGRFTDEFGTLTGEISFTPGNATRGRRSVKFSAPVYLANKDRYGIPKPPSYAYDTAFDVQKVNYQRRVQISHELQPRETDRFTIKVAVSQSSFHHFRATIVDITGLRLSSLPIDLHSFVPRSRRKVIEDKITVSSVA